MLQKYSVVQITGTNPTLQRYSTIQLSGASPTLRMYCICYKSWPTTAKVFFSTGYPDASKELY